MSLDLTPYLDAIENDMQTVVRGQSQAYDGLYGMLRYHLGWQDSADRPTSGRHGKRLRPLLCLLACEASGGDWRRALPAATTLELIHNYTLIHDDIEDDSSLRHQRPTLWTVWGLAQGVNAGDTLWALARSSLYRLSALGHEPQRVLDVAQLLDDTCLALCEGQYLDIASEGDRDMPLETYLLLVQGKTAALTGASLACGALLAGASASLVAWMQTFGRELGLAFQITDDLLGVWGDPEITGKSAASDLAARKMTLPVVYALEWEKKQREHTLYELMAQPPGEEHIAAMLAVLERSGARQAVERRAQESQERMIALWNEMRLSGRAAEALLELALGVVGRQY